MSIEAEKAVSVSYQMEVKKDALRQVQDGGIKLTLSIHPNDVDARIYGDSMGQRYMCVLVPLNEDETPRDDKPKSYAGQAKMLAQENDFWVFADNQDGWNTTNDHESELYIEERCGVKSCSELIEGTPAGKAFKRLQAEYLDWKNRTPSMG